MRESQYRLFVPLLEAFALPELMERTTQKPHANMYIKRIPPFSWGYTLRYNIHKASTVATSLINSESCEVSNSQERALNRRIQKIFTLPVLLPHPGFWTS